MSNNPLEIIHLDTFQFLIGELQTYHYIEDDLILLNAFQFLIGELQTYFIFTKLQIFYRGFNSS